MFFQKINLSEFFGENDRGEKEAASAVFSINFKHAVEQTQLRRRRRWRWQRVTTDTNEA